MEKETNLEHYLHRLKRIVKEKYNSPMLMFDTIQDYIDPHIKHNCVEYTTDILEWMAQEYKGGILDYAENKYLSEVIRPFREKIECIFKAKLPNYDEYYIVVDLEDNDFLRLPCFKGNTMYKGMEVDKEYELEELGL